MIKLTHEQKELFDNHLQEIKVSPNKVQIKRLDKQNIVIPSKMYPLKYQKTIDLFHQATNTEPLEDELASRTYDSLTFETGMCYTNTEKILEAFKKAGLGKYIKSMTGWLFVGDTPVHHCWAVYKDVHVIDPAVNLSQVTFQEEISKLKHAPSADEARKILLDEEEKWEKEPNHIAKIFGQVYPNLMYVGSNTTPQEGRAIFNKLIKDFPDHPSYNQGGMNAHGASRIQEMKQNRR